jgi:hypothetical protein
MKAVTGTNQRSLYSRLMLMRRAATRISLVLLACGLALTIIFGCGGGSSSSDADTSSDAGASIPFSKAGPNEPIVTFGKKAPTQEREAVNAVMVESLTAREEADFATQCKTLNKTGLEEIPSARNQASCPVALRKYAEPLAVTKEVRKDQLSGSINELRAEGEFGYALFHGRDGKDYAWALRKEDGSWKLSAINSIELGPTQTSTDSKPNAPTSKPNAANGNP